MRTNTVEPSRRRAHRCLRTALFALLLLPALPAAAEAATVAVKSVQPQSDVCRFGQCEPQDVLFFTAAAGEANDVTITESGGRYVVGDSGAALLAGPGCVRTSERAATCDAEDAMVELGDRDDRSSGVGHVQGGAGNDVLINLGVGYVSGGAGNDVLINRSRMAVDLVGGPGNDRLTAGGEGSDTLVGGGGNDRLTGGRGNDGLVGGGGNDRLTGGRGNDRLTGGGGNDLLSGGRDADRINSHDGRRDRVDCGQRQDRVIADRVDRVARNCEHVGRRR